MATSILLIEDNPRDQRLVEVALAEAVDFDHVLHAESSLEAGTHRLGEHGIDRVLLDLNVGDSHGADSLRAARGAHPELPVIVLTGLADDELGMEAIRAGAQDFLVKGKMFGELLTRAIRYAKERHRILRELQAK